MLGHSKQICLLRRNTRQPTRFHKKFNIAATAAQQCEHRSRPLPRGLRAALNRNEGLTPAFSKTQACKLLDAPSEDTIPSLRDRAILSVGLQVGLRRAEIAALKVGDLHRNRGFNSLRVTRKRGRRDALTINPQTAAKLRAHVDAAGHGSTSRD